MGAFNVVTGVPALRGLFFRHTGVRVFLHEVLTGDDDPAKGDLVLAKHPAVLDITPDMLDDPERFDPALLDPLPDVVRLTGAGTFLAAGSKAKLARLCGETDTAEVPAVWQRLAGMVAIVTGSAQGFGEGIARELAKAGASVVIADLNGELAADVADSLNRTYGPFTAKAVTVDVGDEASVQAMIEATVRSFGGLDIYISNAGVLRAGSLEEMDLNAFTFVTKINYTAYFIGTKHAARAMRSQNLAAGRGWTDIIQINSKSGLEGSNKNFAYAGGKFGGIGLTQSFAKELVTDRIKVNAICPGNYYEGPLWSDPEKGLFVQYLKAGKVAGAKTVDDVYHDYVAKVPMKKGCSPLDVARAIFYIIEQEYETGQAVPVTGGQVMLH